MSIKKNALVLTLFDVLSEVSDNPLARGSERLRNIRFPKFNKRNIFRYLLPAVLILVAVFIVRQALVPNPQVGNTVIGVSDTKPLATTTLNREFQFPLRNEKGKEVGKLLYTIKDAELRKQIIVKGKRATAVDGRIFLIINLKIVNDLNQGLEVNSRDYVRITVNGKTKELFAPDIHNDPVEVQAISTKNTRVGIAINETDKNIELRIGEINGPKENIKLNF
ncbi:MAG: hypothetical protein A3C30_04465 [Candidatus Levybacteria bacterium RIFCSPHIGHO2_02_FULL_40_18]|nr:MAG: hypothetical protein A2869_01555 [Candidatus Levybacteria bacterium RIFCSPHIGHO2_01_FULL_40_58]OGH26334.1 MAG: hypothetical protein A3C30_04465 [Candidatus Levybacteria bacterium RIFCSPHIGHO2_02_FULL_40_18]OGH31293.1 MAG: hypothetical protein A3E43_02720 [Candidatus Levybacteria bacterium RIFCSPHIGHO2_12_FULL_40_31]OGH40795.1 MAG: hypothetical protein A2894_02155 [Candidatus Levybacteria bacterium RIFCSPLOWO2_01_FULL_40_64]OGH53654.1 MAG: hypothetical protein A3G15_01220 [Candidatus Lev